MNALTEAQQKLGRAEAQYSHSRHTDLDPAPIEPSWILDGAPTARSKFLQATPDDRYVVAIWDCTEGTFRWYFGYDEFVHILEGEVVIRDDDGSERTLRAGDIALFPKGTTNVWRVPKYVRKIAINRFHRRTPVELVKQVLRRGRDELKKLYGQTRTEQSRA